jgi:hypothetical protein
LVVDEALPLELEVGVGVECLAGVAFKLLLVNLLLFLDLLEGLRSLVLMDKGKLKRIQLAIQCEFCDMFVLSSS